MHKKYLDLGIRYLHRLYKGKPFVYHVKRSSKASDELQILQKQKLLKDTPQSSNPITDPEEDEKKRVRAVQRMDMPMRSI